MNETGCEIQETLVSTWMDEGLDRDGQRELLDHLTRCDSCRRFYLDSRALEGLVAITGDDVSAPPPPVVWEKIEEQVAADSDTAGGFSTWALRAAAVVVLGIALAFVPWPTSEAVENDDRQVSIVLEENRGSMTEVRFLQLATEILRADRRFHFAMQEVMEKVVEDEWDDEGGASEGLADKSAKNEGDSRRLRV